MLLMPRIDLASTAWGFGTHRAVVPQVLGLLMLAAGQLSPAQETLPGRRFAVVVGVEAYEHPRLREPQPLKYAVEDASALAVSLKNAGYGVVLMTDDSGRDDGLLKPTRANIGARIRETLRKGTAKDTVVLAFAGHGLQFAGQPDAYFCPLDARPFPDETDTLVSVSGIYSELEKSFAGVKVILVDACRNDPDPGRGRGLDADSAPAPPKGVAALFSCSAGQRAFEHDDLRHGVFFDHVLKGLAGEAANRRDEVTFDSLSSYVRDSVPQTIERLFPGRVQLPNLKADLVGRPPVLAKIGTVPRSAPPTVTAKTLTNTIGMKLVLIPEGAFLMGSTPGDVTEMSRLDSTFEREYADDEQPQHNVRISKPFYIGQYEVTKGEFAKFVTERNYQTSAERLASGAGWNEAKGEFDSGPAYTWRNTGFAQEDTYPVVNVSWHDAVAFCDWLTQKEGKQYRLPTEAEWEYACRAGTTTLWQHGNNHEALALAANIADASLQRKRPNGAIGGITADDGYEFTAPVGQFQPNKWGLYDMHGNVFEWCADWYDEEAYQGRTGTTSDPRVSQADEDRRVLRGGSWNYSVWWTRSTTRSRLTPANRSFFIGFRLVRDP